MKDDDVLVIIGGTDDDHVLSSIEVIGNSPCSVPDFPYSITGHSAVLTPDGIPLVCGATSGLDMDCHECFMFDAEKKEWVKHSETHLCHRYASAIAMPNGVYLLGGYGHEKEFEFLPIGSTSWIDMTHGDDGKLPFSVAESCVTATSDKTFLAMGGMNVSN